MSADPNDDFDKAVADYIAARAADDDSGLLTEDSVAKSFAEHYAGCFVFDHELGAWVEWDGTRWTRDLKLSVFQAAREFAREINSRLTKPCAMLGKIAFASAVERASRADPKLAVTQAIWDTAGWLLGTPAGTVDLRSGKMSPPVPDTYITKATSVAPTPTADCPIWLAFLKDATNGDDGLIRFLQQWVGYSLTGDTREHALLFVYGGGGNGKSVFLNTVSGILADYARSAPMDTFSSTIGDRHTTDLAGLRGARMVCAAETEEGRAWAEVRLKQLTGGDKVSARFMRQDFFEYIPQFKLTIVGNYKPILSNVDDAAKRRINMAPFLHKPPVEDKQLETKLRAEWPGILRWAIDGCLDWQANGLIRPSVVTDATAEYFGDQDTLKQWIEECCECSPSYEDKNSSLYGSWANYAKDRGETVGSQKRFKPALQRLGYTAIKDTPSTRGRGFRGLKVKVTWGAT